ncbi:hypothetical protein PoB_004881500 [Plakobranchus ocellatus]|uniref:Uncharacterized protein n=1 Tax=Plakobranchus ocellatus TaxID=259542 RepID=A0AAV4BSP5_9GAST|nr:hypothetical protein PoB_004881500 [Plakobranchus ocellatus]
MSGSATVALLLLVALTLVCDSENYGASVKNQRRSVTIVNYHSVPMDASLSPAMKQSLLREVRRIQRIGFERHRRETIRRIKRSWRQDPYDEGPWMMCPTNSHYVTMDHGKDMNYKNITLSDESGYSHIFYEVFCMYDVLASENSDRPNCPKCCRNMKKAMMVMMILIADVYNDNDDDGHDNDDNDGDHDNDDDDDDDGDDDDDDDDVDC